MKSQQADDQPTDHGASRFVVDFTEQKVTYHHANDGGRHHGQDAPPAAAFSIDEKPHDVCHDEQG